MLKSYAYGYGNLCAMAFTREKILVVTERAPADRTRQRLPRAKRFCGLRVRVKAKTRENILDAIVRP